MDFLAITLGWLINASLYFWRMKLLIPIIGFQLFVISVNAQLFPVKSYPSQDFRYPLGIPMRLNANFGEMRSNHFHMGLDLYTEQKENLSVYTAAEGWVSRIRIDPTGYGNALFVSHPNGLTTLYAHMNTFIPAIDKALEEARYAYEKWGGDFNFEEGKIPVAKDQFIGKSGNTGASTGPHVHYEIRRTENESCVNPLLIYKVDDSTPPVIKKFAIYDRSKSTYEQSPQLFTPVLSGKEYKLLNNAVTVKSRKISVAIEAIDQVTGVPNQNGVFEVIVYLDEKPLSGYQMDDIAIGQTRYLNGHVDYPYYQKTGVFLQHLTPLPGNRLPIYYRNGDGIIEMREPEHQLRIEVKDQNGNISVLRCVLKNDTQQDLPNNRTESDSRYMMPGTINVFEREDIQVISSETAFYDGFVFKYAVKPFNGISPLHLLHDSSIPIHDSITVRIKPSVTLSKEKARQVVMIRTGKGKTDIRSTTLDGGWYQASFRDFGAFRLQTDELSPSVKITGLMNGMTVRKGHLITCHVADNLGKVKKFRAEIDGQWVLFTGRGPLYQYKVDHHCPPGEHTLTVMAEDMAGNTITREISFKRN